LLIYGGCDAGDKGEAGGGSSRACTRRSSLEVQILILCVLQAKALYLRWGEGG